MEFVVVTFQGKRTVNVDGTVQGDTGEMLRLPAGTHIFDLGTPDDYVPAQQTLGVSGTSHANPLVVVFSPATSFAALGATNGALHTRRVKRGGKPPRKPRAGRIPISERVFDARPDRVDFRDLPYNPPLRSLPPRYPTDDLLADLLPSYLANGLILDQGTEGACTGFGLACVVNYLLWTRHVATGSTGAFGSVSPRMLYELAKRYDEWPGERYDGSSCRGALKGWHKHGVCSAALWPYELNGTGHAPFVPPKDGWDADALSRTVGVYYRVARESVVDIQAALVNIGAVYVSARVHSGWDDLQWARAKPAPRAHQQVPDIPLPKRPGKLSGHAFALVGYDERGFIVQNSWGKHWGAGGFGRLLYSDWAAHGTDAWACALGVPAEPTADRTLSVRWRKPAGRSVVQLERVGRATRNPANDPWPVDHEFTYRPYEPLSTADAYACSLVTGNDGELSVRDMTIGGADAAEDYARATVLERPRAWFAKQKGRTVRLAIYAHGGLNSEDPSIARVRVLAPYFFANDIYPIFLVWRTGPVETLQSMLADWVSKIPGIGQDTATGGLEWFSDQKDRALEAIARPFGRGVWSEMRENAMRGMRMGNGLELLVRNLAHLGNVLTAQERKLEVHLVGHSAGAILLGHCLEAMITSASQWPYRIGSCSLFAAACSVLFANQRYSVEGENLLPLERLWLYCLSDENEKCDALPTPKAPIYGKSLLYLVSRACDADRKEPLLGMERAHLPRYASDEDQWAEEQLIEVRKWQQRWRATVGHDARLRIVKERSVRTTRDGMQVQSTHGSFDNNIEVLTETIQRIRGQKIVSPMEWLDY